MVLVDPSRPWDPFIEQATTQCFIHNHCYRAMIYMTEWLDSVPAANQHVL